jgi:hypothetical protein
MNDRHSLQTTIVEFYQASVSKMMLKSTPICKGWLMPSYTDPGPGHLEQTERRGDRHQARKYRKLQALLSM